MRRPLLALLLLLAAATPAAARNVLLFVADGMRYGMVTPQNAPTMSALLDRGVRFTNTHALFPTFTTANASAMATGHLLGDSGDFSNTIYSGFALTTAGGSLTPFLENDAVLGEMDAHFNGNYLNEKTVLAAARDAGLSTALVGKVGPALIFDHTDRDGEHTIVIDDTTGRPGGIPLSADMQAALKAAELEQVAPTRGENGKTGNATTPGTLVANVQQQGYFADVVTKVLLPMFKQRGKPFVIVFWSRDPDGTQHFQGDSLGQLSPGINGPTSLASIRNADDNLRQIETALKDLGLDGDTDVVLTADHGFSTISKESSSYAATQHYDGVPAGQLPPGFLAIDLAHGLGMALRDPDAKNADVAAGHFPAKGDGLIGGTAEHPEVVVAANGGSDLVYVPSGDPTLAAEVVRVLQAQDYVSGLFVDSRFGEVPGTLPLSAIGMEGSAVTPHPAIAVSFRSWTTGCTDGTTCTVEIADTGLQQGQGMHGSFSRADTRNVMGAVGPDFRAHAIDEAPASNPDLGLTIASVLHLDVPAGGKLPGRVLTEAMPDGQAPEVRSETVSSKPDTAGHATVLRIQLVGQTRYFDVAGYPGRTVGLQ
ncbi:MAG TPA: alkaline phosphatase family protein [Acidisphaera sp.]|nr:alkaline phosphatase family protein [Acidisphaera sp.]